MKMDAFPFRFYIRKFLQFHLCGQNVTEILHAISVPIICADKILLKYYGMQELCQNSSCKIRANVYYARYVPKSPMQKLCQKTPMQNTCQYIVRTKCPHHKYTCKDYAKHSMQFSCHILAGQIYILSIRTNIYIFSLSGQIAPLLTITIAGQI